MLKRGFDVLFSGLVLLIAGPALIIVLLLVWLQDGHDPFYRARRVGRGGADFIMLKVRSMIVNAERTGVNSTSTGDARVTTLGRLIRRYKIDEISQFLNVLRGDMSIVGPRPNTRAWGVDLYTPVERQLLDLRPGITDLASIVFADEGEILAGAAHADLRYNQVIRPWKSRLGLFYSRNASLLLDLRIIRLTALAIVDREKALDGVVRILKEADADADLIAVCRRDGMPPAGVPPGSTSVFAVDGLASGSREAMAM